MKKHNEFVYDQSCPVRVAMDLIGGKWKIPILWTIHGEGSLRYNQMKRNLVGITNTMLAKSLKELEAGQLVERTQFNEIPPRVEYKLTQKSIDLMEIIQNLSQWSQQYNG